MSQTEALPGPEAEAEHEPGWWEDDPIAVVVYENWACYVDRSFVDGTHRVVRSADSHVIGTYGAGERDYFQACQQANRVAGRPRRPVRLSTQ